LQPLRCKIDPGSRITGIALVRNSKEAQFVLALFELQHRGLSIRDALQARSAYRRRRRGCLRYRAPRFSNRGIKKGWLPPSLQHRVQSTEAWVTRFIKWAPITSVTCEVVRFNTQKLTNPEIQGIEYQQGTLHGYEVREYLLEKWGRKCTYCKKENIPLQIDHIVPKSRGGSDRVDNLTLACGCCNQLKGNQSLKEFAPHLSEKINQKRSLVHSAAVNSTRNALWESLTKKLLPYEAGTGGQTKYNRERLSIPKTHALDAACAGEVIELKNWKVPILKIQSSGRGAYQRTRTDRFGFPRGYLSDKKFVHGFKTGDHATATVPSGKKAGKYTGRVAIRASGNFNIQTAQGVVQGISWRHCRLVQRGDGYHYMFTAQESKLITEEHASSHC